MLIELDKPLIDVMTKANLNHNDGKGISIFKLLLVKNFNMLCHEANWLEIIAN